MVVTVDGIIIASKTVLESFISNIFDPMTVSPLSKVAPVRELHLEKALSTTTKLIILLLLYYEIVKWLKFTYRSDCRSDDY